MVNRTFLEMRENPLESIPQLESCTLQLVSPCSPSFYPYLYTEVGKDYSWFDRLIWSEAKIKEYLNQPEVSIWVLFSGGNPAGFFEIKQYPVTEANQGTDNSVEIVYFGLMPEFIGQGLGKCLLNQAIAKAWELAPQKIWLHTCSLDHPHALGNYLDRGFQVFKEDSFLEKQRSMPPTG